MKKIFLKCALGLGLSFSLAAQDSTTADTVLYGGPIYTAVDSTPTAEAVAIKNGRFIYVGDRAGLNTLIGDNTTEIDLAGSALYPGFVDGHAHLKGIGNRELTLNLEGVLSIEELQEALLTWREAHPDELVIRGRGWIETHWPEKRFPSRFDIDAVITDIPVILSRADGHALVANSKAFEMANVTSQTDVPSGGEILQNAVGELTGIMVDNAQRLIYPAAVNRTRYSIEEELIKGGEVYASYGWTGMHNVSVSWDQVSPMESLSDSSQLKIRVHNSVDPSDAVNLFTGGSRINASGRVETRAIKMYIDGALGSRGAALLEPYTDRPDTSGLLVSQKEDVMPIMQDALRHGYQVNMHAIGDRGTRLVLDWYEEAFNAVPISERAVANPRWRIEHAQNIHSDDLPRFAALGVVPSMQASHAIGDLHFAPDRLGDVRLDGAYAWRDLIDAGNIIVGGSDAPVERGNPLIEFYAAVARRDLAGFQGDNWRPNQAVTREEALKMFTLWAAQSVFQEGELGSIEVGKKADLSAFSVDIMTADFADIPTAHAVLTMVDGEIMYVYQ